MKQISDSAELAAFNEALLDFTDILFYNFRFFDVSRNAFERIAGFFDICRVTVCICKGSKREKEEILFENEEFTADTCFEEKSIHSVYGDTAIYRIYRKKDAKPLSMKMRRALEFVFKTTHTYLNRSISIDTALYSKTHAMHLGCLNSVGFMEELAGILMGNSESDKYAIIFMNAKKFKTINGKVGFDNGNAVIRIIADNLRTIAGKDGKFAYMGGDNFVFFTEKERLGEAVSEINSISCEITHNGQRHVINVNFRMGIYIIDKKEKDVKAAMENASIAFSFARQSRRSDIVYYTNEKRQEYEHRKMLENELKPAMNRGDILVYFQPKVNLEDSSLAGAEALSRWRRNDKIIPPSSFIPIFEQNGMISDMDFYVFEKICAAVRDWIDRGFTPVTVSVNFSKITLEAPYFTERITALTDKYKVPVKYLEIEFTETCCMENESKFTKLLTELKKLGFSTSLDDFGTGFSSINLLKNMHFDVLKLDRSFLTDEKLNNEREKIILSSVIKMAHSLNLEVVSEGVETPEQIEYLRRLKCRKAQGYYFGKPMPQKQFEKLLENDKNN